MLSEEKSLNEIINDMEKDFEIFSNQAKEFIRKWGNPHRKIIIEQDGIEVVDGVKAKPFEPKETVVVGIKCDYGGETHISTKTNEFDDISVVGTYGEGRISKENKGSNNEKENRTST